jgi:hypothetical protein
LVPQGCLGADDCILEGQATLPVCADRLQSRVVRGREARARLTRLLQHQPTTKEKRS